LDPLLDEILRKMFVGSQGRFQWPNPNDRRLEFSV
jgi:hypothetical protein